MGFQPWILSLTAGLVLSLVTFQVLGQHESAKTCENLGFTGLALCSDCDSFAEYVKDEELVADCKKCCSQESEDSISKITYAGAILEVCMRKIAFYPDIRSFVEDDSHKYPALKVRYLYGSSPKLIMLDQHGDNKETIRIDNWKREHIEQFLKEKVNPKSVAE